MKNIIYLNGHYFLAKECTCSSSNTNSIDPNILNSKLEKLISGLNIKSINEKSILEPGNLDLVEDTTDTIKSYARLKDTWVETITKQLFDNTVGVLDAGLTKILEG